MEIVVVGAGSVGMLIASFLSEFNDRVTLLPRKKEQAINLQQNGLLRRNLDGTISKHCIDTRMEFSNLSKDSLVIIAVKYGQLQDIYKSLHKLNPSIPLIFLQNGIAHLEEAKKLPQQSIAFGSCQFGAERENDTTVLHRGQGILKIAVEKGDTQLFSLFSKSPNPIFQVEFVESAEKMLFEKAIFNCLINPLTAILEVTNGKLVEFPQNKFLLERLYKELLEAFPKEMSQFSFSDVENLCQRTATNTSSMLGDIVHSRPTEIETIVGTVLKRAAQMGKSLPMLETLYLLVLAKEGRSEKM